MLCAMQAIASGMLQHIALHADAMRCDSRTATTSPYQAQAGCRRLVQERHAEVSTCAGGSDAPPTPEALKGWMGFRRFKPCFPVLATEAGGGGTRSSSLLAEGMYHREIRRAAKDIMAQKGLRVHQWYIAISDKPNQR
eukprot:CAMPEP_0115282886 /NCGR_PEP_ID=MMETSP0270-20121206/60080_1 /TAXON_ID=71861 /ORGANISM="Scrippsiella trochoidea, Strain CCMP3099" /LENGTH=137 /DNA_ID=CAMNT_0002699759 /DNA_START=61 /DNA_END=472 /DNA_ORIENTATION=+